MPRSTLCLLALLLTACGQSGALYLPDQAPPKPSSKTRVTAQAPAAENTQPGAEESKQKKDAAAPTQP